MKKVIATTLILILTSALLVTPAMAAPLVPYDTYTYDYWENIVFTPAAYVPGENISGITLGIGPLNNPQGLTTCADGLVYIADTGNSRIIILESDLHTVRNVIYEFDNNGVTDTFDRPRGVAVSLDGLLYVADTENRRVLTLDGETVVRTIQNPESDLLGENFDFVPLKVTVDFAGRVFVIARNMFQGIMTFNPAGNFIGFYGTINVTITLWQQFWRAMATQEQRARQQMFIPTEFTGLDVDPLGFVFASNIDRDGVQSVRRLNPHGDDVIRTGTNENLGGDLVTLPFSPSPFSGPSNIVDVTYRGHGMYSLLCSRRGRIFTYDAEGNLLYIFGGVGQQAGLFRQPTAIAYHNGHILALDGLLNELITFAPTLYGTLINEAVALRFSGDETLAVAKWREVLLLNENLELANAGIGRAYLTAGDNVSAMRYLRLGMDRHHYSIAFRRHRNEVLSDNISWILTTGLVLIVGVVTFRAIRRRRNGYVQEGDMMDVS